MAEATLAKSKSADALNERKEARKLMDTADDALAAIDASDFSKEHSVKRDYPLFAASEIATGDVLGVGSFGVVFEVDEIILEGQKDEETSQPGQVAAGLDKAASSDGANKGENVEHYEVSTARAFMAANFKRNGVDARYALKILRHDHSELQRARGMIDLAIETKLLSRLWHPNIVKMRGFSTGPMLHHEFFIIMDRLYETLDQRIETWRTDLYPDGEPGLLKKVFGRRSGAQGHTEEAERDVQVQRLIVAYDLASAFLYMHQHQLVYRDIKPENIGFDVRGDVKVFDFGLSKGLSPSLRAKDEKTGLPVYGYNLTPRTGSIPYMAPEIALCQPYDSKCDVFSFAILLWEIFSLKTAFKGYKIPDYLGRVVRGNERPPLPKKIRPLTKLVVKESWDHDPTKRPDMKRVASMIRGDLNDMSDDTSVQNRTKHMCDRSRQSFRLNQRVQYKAYDQMVKPLGFRLSQRAQSE